jgi:hypothetical protein
MLLSPIPLLGRLWKKEEKSRGHLLSKRSERSNIQVFLMESRGHLLSKKKERSDKKSSSSSMMKE